MTGQGSIALLLLKDPWWALATKTPGRRPPPTRQLIEDKRRSVVSLNWESGFSKIAYAVSDSPPFVLLICIL